MVLVTLYDIRSTHIPSYLTTSMLFVVVFLNFNNLFFGILAGLLSLLMYDLSVISGLADIKVSIVIGMMISSIFWFNIFVICLFLFSIAYQGVLMWQFPYLRNKGVPFMPVYLSVYITLLLGGAFL